MKKDGHLFCWLLLLQAAHHYSAASTARYSLQHAYAGPSFFSGWNYWGGKDNLTNGNTYYVEQSRSQNVAYVSSNGNAIIKVDNSTDLAAGGYRNSIRITSIDGYGIGSLFVLDAVQYDFTAMILSAVFANGANSVPFGCSVWPAFWVHGAEWPSGGEIDVFEGVNMQATNQVAMHTVTGCYASPGTVSQVGRLTSDNCDYRVNGNQGCTVLDGRNQSYGAGFASAGGGVWAMELASTGVSVWFFPRGSVPPDLANPSTNSSTPDPTTWTSPVAHYSNSSCNVNSYFAQQYITINIALCGDWAGNAAVFAQTCSGTCIDTVAAASAYSSAYFEISSVRVYGGGISTLNTSTAVHGIAGANQTIPDNGSGVWTGSPRFRFLLQIGLILFLLALCLW